MPIQPPPNQADIPLPAASSDRPTPFDVTAAKDYGVKIYATYIVGGNHAPSFQDVSNSEAYLQTLIAKSAGGDVAPPWFAAAITTALEPINERLGRIDTRLDRIDARLDRIDASVSELQVDTAKVSFTAYDNPQFPDVVPQNYNATCGNGLQCSFRPIKFPDGTVPAAHNLPALENVLHIQNLTNDQTRVYFERYGLQDFAGITYDRKRQMVATHIGCREPVAL
ncbi:hypothetical protein D9758_008105 [Tetrapyrgos nigripes]|uniref:Mug135-like C-terminal domain-containing protein n=1 Tax=Tetrapyrgos nigripes TaxID=182062 RepID=A0A8H5GH38_9AGAR|nr:hypothetical protein D9758_008105 [Tetrapyrgos nigripes]